MFESLRELFYIQFCVVFFMYNLIYDLIYELGIIFINNA